MLLALDLGEVGIGRQPRQAGAMVARQLRRVGRIGEVGADLEQGARRVDGGCLDQGRFVGIGQRQDEGAHFVVAHLVLA